LNEKDGGGFERWGYGKILRMSLTIHPLVTAADFDAVEDMQRVVWAGDPTPVPAAMLMVAAHNGGLALGAFEEGRLIGFVFGILGIDESRAQALVSARLKHHSHMLAVLPEYRDRHVGFQLKLAQRDSALGQGLKRVTWTYDPLEGRNAHLNIARLGAVCKTYLRNAYGEMRDAMNQGLPSDRFQVDWWITSERVSERLSGEFHSPTLHTIFSPNPEPVNPSVGMLDDEPRPAKAVRHLSKEVELVEIPGDFQRLKAGDLELAGAWREQTRGIFEEAFGMGYTVTDFYRASLDGRMRSFYTLSRQPEWAGDPGGGSNEN
jgi:predicted GNAT superfamily acetyltransferase